MTYQTLIVETDQAVTLIRLNRPEALNALNGQLMGDWSPSVNLFPSLSLRFTTVRCTTPDPSNGTKLGTTAPL